MRGKRRAGVGFILAIACFALGLGCLHTPLGWSPDGRWIAYTTETVPEALLLRPGWLFRSRAPGTLPAPEHRPPGEPRTYQLWISRADNSTSLLIDESPLPIGSPGWSPDGKALAYARISNTPRDKEPAGLRLELVIREGLERKRVVFSRPLKELPPEADRLPGQAAVWSPDAHMVALPQVDPAGILIVQAGNGRVVRFIDDAYLPAWSGDGGKLAYYLRGETDQLTVSEVRGGAPRTLLDVGQAGQAPVWTRDSSGLLAMVHKSGKAGEKIPTERLELVRVHVETGMVDSIRSLNRESNPDRQRAVQGASFAIDKEGATLFHTVAVEGQPRQLTWYQVPEGVTYKSFTPLDMNMTIGSLAVSPAGSHLAFRVGEPELRLPPVVYELYPSEADKASPLALLVPDDRARMAWIGYLASHGHRLLQSSWRSGDGSVPPDRPLRLPVGGEAEPLSEISLRIKRLGRLGRQVCRRPADAPALDLDDARVLDEARLFFECLAGDDPTATEAAIERLERTVTTREERRSLFSARALAQLAQGDVDAAERTIRYLRKTGPSASYRVEQTARGPVLVAELSDENAWANYLQSRVVRVREQIKNSAPEDDEPLGHRNPDAPQPGLGLDLNPNAGPDIRDLRPFGDELPPPRLILPPPRGQ